MKSPRKMATNIRFVLSAQMRYIKVRTPMNRKKNPNSIVNAKLEQAH